MVLKNTQKRNEEKKSSTISPINTKYSINLPVFPIKGTKRFDESQNASIIIKSKASVYYTCNREASDEF